MGDNGATHEGDAFDDLKRAIALALDLQRTRHLQQLGRERTALARLDQAVSTAVPPLTLAPREAVGARVQVAA